MKKRSDGRYSKQIFLGYKSDGKKDFKTVYGKTVKEVERKEREILCQIENGSFIRNDMTLSSWADIWLKTYKTNVEKRTLDMYELAVYKHIKPTLGHIHLSDLKTVQIQGMLNDLSNTTPRTAQICRLTIRQMVKYAVADGLMVRDVTTTLKPIKRTPKPKEVLSEGEIVALERADFTPQEEAFISILRYTGVRCGEALALTVQDIDFDSKSLDINKNLLFDECVSVLKSPKSKAGYRRIPIPDKLVRILEAYIRTLSTDILFPMGNGNYRTKSSYQKFWKSIIKKTKAAAADINPQIEITFTPHIFRHTYATNLYYADVDIKTAQYLLGHSTVQMTLDVYTHLDHLHTEQAAEKINSYFRECPI